MRDWPFKVQQPDNAEAVIPIRGPGSLPTPAQTAPLAGRHATGTHPGQCSGGSAVHGGAGLADVHRA